MIAAWSILVNNWKITLTVLVVLIILLLWLLKWRKKPFKQGTGTIPGDPKDAQDKLTDDEVRQINDLGKRLYEDINGISWLARDADAYTETSKVSDRVLVGIYNLYRSQTNNSLIADIQGETYYITWNYSGDKKDHPYYTSKIIVERLKNLKLS